MLSRGLPRHKTKTPSGNDCSGKGLKEKVLAKILLAIAVCLIAFAAALMPVRAGEDDFPVSQNEDDYPEGKFKLFGKRYSLAITGGFSEPSSGVFRGFYGGGRPGIGVSLFRPETEKTRFDADFVFKYYENEGMEAIILGLTGGVHHNFVEPKASNSVPFVEFHAGPYMFLTPGYVTADLPSQGVAPRDPPGTSLTGGLNAALGVEINECVVLNVRYDYIAKVGGVNPSFWSAGILFKVW